MHHHNSNTEAILVFSQAMQHGLWDHAAAAKSLQSCPTLCDPRDGSPPGSAVPGILQARTLEWVAISFSNAWKWKVKVKSLSRVRLLATPWTAATRLLHPWDFPGKSTGVGCHCLLHPTCLVSFKEEETGTTHRAKALWRHNRTAAICRTGGEASGESNPACILVLDFQPLRCKKTAACFWATQAGVFSYSSTNKLIQTWRRKGG